MVGHPNILHLAKNMLASQDKLHPLLFDEQGVMFEDKRQKLLDIANLYIRRFVSQISDISVEDIILLGSSATYLYTASSDFDVDIILDVTKCKVIGSNTFGFMRTLNEISIKEKAYYKLDGHLIDLKFAFNDGYLGCYSLLRNEWNIPPQKNLNLDAINPGLIVKGFYKQRAIIYDYLSQLQSKNGYFSMTEVKKTSEIYSVLLSGGKKIKYNVSEGILDFFILKLIRKFRYLKKLAKFELETINDSLSLK